MGKVSSNIWTTQSNLGDLKRKLIIFKISMFLDSITIAKNVFEFEFLSMDHRTKRVKLKKNQTVLNKLFCKKK